MEIEPHALTHKEAHSGKIGQKLNSLRAAVLGANDGIVSVAAIVVGVAGASTSLRVVLTAGVAGLIAGALSMAVGEYVSVSTQRDTEKALLDKERFELENSPKEELEELASIYERKGLSEQTAKRVAEELTLHDAFTAHVDVELGIDLDELTNPWHAATASGLSFLCGGLIPLVAITISNPALRVPSTFFSVLIALIITGVLSAYIGGAKKFKAMVRVVLGGALAMAITFLIGKLAGGVMAI